jgi:hypothetical protein
VAAVNQFRIAQQRWLVHLGLMATLAVSLWFEPILAIHVAFGLAFAGLVAAHLTQRRRVSANLVARLARPALLRTRPGRLAAADLLLLALTLVMLVSGFWDLLAIHPTRLRWHAISGIGLTGLLVVHTARRWRRLRTSKVR